MTTLDERQQADQDDADRFAQRSIRRTTHRAHIHELTTEIDRLRAEENDWLNRNDELVAQNDEVRAALTRVEVLCDEGEDRRDWIAVAKLRDTLKTLYVDAPSESTHHETDCVVAECPGWVTSPRVHWVATHVKDCRGCRDVHDNAVNKADDSIRRGLAQAAAGQASERPDLIAPTVPGEPCPDSCGGQPWTWVGTSLGRRWRCDTCNRIIPGFISDAIQAADDRRAL